LYRGLGKYMDRTDELEIMGALGSSSKYRLKDRHILCEIYAFCTVNFNTGRSEILCAMKHSVDSNNPHTIDDLWMVITEHVRNLEVVY
jgi:hypothetical protein